MARLPANGLTVSHDHCVMASVPVLDGVVNTLWEKSWENPANQAVMTKTYVLNGVTVTEVRLRLSPANHEGVSDKTVESVIRNTTNASIQEMLVSIDKGQHVLVGEKESMVRDKFFERSGDKWSCALNVKGWPDFPLLTEIIDQDTMIHAAKKHDFIYPGTGGAQIVIRKEFKEVRPNEYEVTAVTFNNGYINFTTTRNIDWNGVFLTAQRGDSILMNKNTYTVRHKICVVTRSNQNYVTPYLEVD